MDPRHESYKQGMLNHIINTINVYMKDHTDTFVVNDSAQEKIKHICKQIYRYLGVRVDVDGVISRHNLLSIDVVTLPVVEDPEAQRILKQDDFVRLIEDIYAGLNKMNGVSAEDELYARIRHVVEEYSGE